MLLAQTLAKQKNAKAALDAAQKAEKLGGENTRILQGLANFYATLSPDLPKAAELGIKYAERSPNDATAWRRLTAFCLSSGQPERAVEAGTRGVAVDDTPEMHTLLGKAYVERKDWAKAAAEMKTALKQSPYLEDSHFQLAQVYLVQQDWASAIDVLQNARKTFDKSAQIELALGVAYYGQRKFPDAVSQFFKTMALAPDVPQSYVFIGRMMDHVSDRLPEVTERFAQFQARNPKSYLGYLLYAKALGAQLPASGNPPEAEKVYQLLQKSLELNDKDAETHYLIGLMLERRRDFEQAAKQLERSIELNPNDSAVHFRLARVYDRLGRKEDAARERAIHEKQSEPAAVPKR